MLKFYPPSSPVVYFDLYLTRVTSDFISLPRLKIVASSAKRRQVTGDEDRNAIVTHTAVSGL